VNKTIPFAVFVAGVSVMAVVFHGGTTSVAGAGTTRRTSPQTTPTSASLSGVSAKVSHWTSNWGDQSKREVVEVSGVRVKYATDANWAGGSGPDPEVRDYLSFVARSVAESDRSVSIVVPLARAKSIQFRWRENHADVCAFSSLRVELWDGGVQQVDTATPPQGNNAAQYLYRVSDGTGTVVQELRCWIYCQLTEGATGYALGQFATRIPYRWIGFVGQVADGTSPSKAWALGGNYVDRIDFVRSGR
jgi:hypothetical protein